MYNRLSKILAHSGVSSRRHAEKLIWEGRVSVDGQVILKPEEKFTLGVNKILVDGEEIQAEKKVYYILNKPSGFLCTNVRPGKQKIALDLFPKVKERIYSIGRLDRESEGLLLMTNDGEFANQVMHPKSNIEKEYLVKVNAFLSHDHLVKLSKGIFIDNKFVKPVRVKKIRKNTCSITVKEGKKHEVRLIAEKAGLKVLTLKRIRIGSLVLGKLKVGEHRFLKEKERELIFN